MTPDPNAVLLLAALLTVAGVVLLGAVLWLQVVIVRKLRAHAWRSSALTVEVTADTSQAEAALGALRTKVEALRTELSALAPLGGSAALRENAPEAGKGGPA